PLRADQFLLPAQPLRRRLLARRLFLLRLQSHLLLRLAVSVLRCAAFWTSFALRVSFKAAAAWGARRQDLFRCELDGCDKEVHSTADFAGHKRKLLKDLPSKPVLKPLPEPSRDKSVAAASAKADSKRASAPAASTANTTSTATSSLIWKLIISSSP